MVHKKTLKHISDILDLLRVGGQMHLRGMAKALNLNPFLVSNIIDNYLEPFIDIKTINEFGFKAKLISLKAGKENTTLNEVLRYLKVKKQIKSNNTSV